MRGYNENFCPWVWGFRRCRIGLSNGKGRGLDLQFYPRVGECILTPGKLNCLFLIHKILDFLKGGRSFFIMRGPSLEGILLIIKGYNMEYEIY